jgi:hypothetical protein
VSSGGELGRPARREQGIAEAEAGEAGGGDQGLARDGTHEREAVEGDAHDPAPAVDDRPHGAQEMLTGERLDRLLDDGSRARLHRRLFREGQVVEAADDKTVPAHAPVHAAAAGVRRRRDREGDLGGEGEALAAQRPDPFREERDERGRIRIESNDRDLGVDGAGGGLRADSARAS